MDEITAHILGWHQENGKWIDADGVSTGFGVANSARGILPVWEPEENIAQAWALIEHHPHYVSLTRSNDNGRFGFKDHMTWKCRFYAPQSLEAEADTAPLAICLAAKAAAESA